MVGVAAAIALDQRVSFEFAEIVTQLVQPVRFGGELKGDQEGFVDLLGGPAADGVAAVQENLQQADDPGVMDFNAGKADRTDGDG